MLVRSFAALLTTSLLSASALADIPGPPGGGGGGTPPVFCDPGSPSNPCGSGPTQPGGATFAVIAFARSNGSIGASSGLDLNGASQTAVTQCRYTGARDCTVVENVQNGCVALAADMRGAWGTAHALGTSRTATQQAIDLAVADCRQYSDHFTPCNVRIYRCSDDQSPVGL